MKKLIYIFIFFSTIGFSQSPLVLASIQQANAINLGPELVTNGTFTTDTDWNKLNGTTISGGQAHVIGNGNIGATGSNHSLIQYFVFDDTSTTKDYRVVFKARQTGGTGQLVVGYAYTKVFEQVITSTLTEYTVDIINLNGTGNTLNDRIVFGSQTAGDTFDLDDVSVKEILP